MGLGRYRGEGNFKAFFHLCDDKGWGDGKIDIHCNPPGSPLTPLVGLNRESMESNLTHLRLPGLNIGDGQQTTYALGRNLNFRASLQQIVPQCISLAI